MLETGKDALPFNACFEKILLHETKEPPMLRHLYIRPYLGNGWTCSISDIAFLK
jgi:hypothetical protein